MKLKPWQILFIPLAIIAAILLYIAHAKNEDFAIWAICPFVLAAAAWVMGPQIDWWWYQRNPPSLDAVVERIIDDYFSFYKTLSPELKKRFRDRTALFMLGNEFIRPPRPDEGDEKRPMPEDIKAAVAACAVHVNFGKENYLTGKFENIVVYPHPFPTPQYEAFHTSEIFEPDGVLLFSAEQLMQGFNNPQQFFSIGLYEYARVFKILHHSVSYPVLGENIWESLEKISGMKQNVIESIIGLPNVDIFGVAVHHFLTFGDRFLLVLPDVYQLLSNIFNQNPVDTGNPVLKY
jgi:Mlc titration factor MtfA (ptsG expression regulator)